MSPKRLRQTLEAVEARPFTVSLSDGRRFDVPHTDYVMLTPDAGTVILLEGGDALKVVDAEHITSIDYKVAKRAKRSGAAD